MWLLRVQPICSEMCQLKWLLVLCSVGLFYLAAALQGHFLQGGRRSPRRLEMHCKYMHFAADTSAPCQH